MVLCKMFHHRTLLSFLWIPVFFLSDVHKTFIYSYFKLPLCLADIHFRAGTGEHRDHFVRRAVDQISVVFFLPHCVFEHISSINIWAYLAFSTWKHPHTSGILSQDEFGCLVNFECMRRSPKILGQSPIIFAKFLLLVRMPQCVPKVLRTVPRWEPYMVINLTGPYSFFLLWFKSMRSKLFLLRFAALRFAYLICLWE